MPEKSSDNPEPITVGSIPATGNSDIRFYVSKYRGKLYGHVRKYVKTESYAGPTQAGVTMTKEGLDQVVKAIEPLRVQDKPGEQELARIERGPGLQLVVRISLYKEKAGIDLREWVETESYTGWSKKGVRIPYDHLPQVQQYLSKMLVFFRKEG